MKEVIITHNWCKGCGICVAFCPHGVLGLDEEEKVVLVKKDNCTFCRLCELRCPDFAIEVRDSGMNGAPDASAAASMNDTGSNKETASKNNAAPKNDREEA